MLSLIEFQLLKNLDFSIREVLSSCIVLSNEGRLQRKIDIGGFQVAIKVGSLK